MPVYEYQHPKTRKVVEVVQRMNDNHVFVDDQGVEWRRVFSVPGAARDTRIDDYSCNEFVNKTKDKGMTMGQLWDESEAASGRREKKLGKDPVKESHFKDYSKKRSGMKHEKDPTKKGIGPIEIV